MGVNIDQLTDGHVHTRLCHHASGSMEDYVRAAIAKGLKRLVFLEHLEMGIDYFEATWLSTDDFAVYHDEGRRLQERYSDTIEVGLGVEVGYNPQEVDALARFIERYCWDRVGLSYHFMRENNRHINMLSRKQVNLDAFSKIGVASIVRRYFDGLIEAVQILPVQVLCHLDAVLRFHPDLQFTDENRDQILTLLEILSRKKISLEVNTSGFVHRGEPYPQKWILHKALEKGIQLCLGSDAHHPKDVGRYFNRFPEWFMP